MNTTHTDMKTKIFIDGGDADESRRAAELRGFLDGQTTNPSLAVKNPEVKKRLESGEKLSAEEALELYKKLVADIAAVTDGPVSIQVFGNHETSVEDMLAQARNYKQWIPNGFVKFPCIPAGLEAAAEYAQEGAVNITLVFSQSQAAAVYQALKDAKHPAFISPFVGRIDDRGECGMDVVAHILKMYRERSPDPDKVQVLTASVRHLEHLYYAIQLKSPAATVPFKVFTQWADTDFALPQLDWEYQAGDLGRIAYQNLSLDRPWQEYDLHHDLTDAGLEKFYSDWMSLQE